MAIKSGQLKEKEDYQKYILEALSEDNGYQIRPATAFSAGYGMDVDVLFAFLEDTQKETLTRLEKLYKDKTKTTILNYINNEKRQRKGKNYDSSRRNKRKQGKTCKGDTEKNKRR